MGHWLVWCLYLWAARPFLVSAVCPPEPGWRLPCGLATINSTECIKQGCCFQSPSLSGQSCFYNLRDSPVCTADGQFIVAITRNLTHPALNLSSLYVKDGHEAECRPKLITAELVAFRFPITSCGSTQWTGQLPIKQCLPLQEENGSFVYETDVLGKRMIQTGPLGSITRDSTFSLHIRCKYKGEHEAGLQINVSVYTLPPPLAASEDGILRLELRIATDGSYSWWYRDSDYPIQRILQESVFVEVHVKDRTDPMIVLRLRDCWATPVPAPDHEVQWSLLVDGCPYEGDDYLTLLHPVGVSSGLQFPTHHKRFEVKTFVFLDGVSEQPLSGQVYLHCSAEVCSPSAQDDCTTRCGPS
ncbi:zona pellucida sperm-binding protein 4-like, partial [Chiloscyllium plagiosum]|uniref:zona pellucida sperm-binding protein 4-like n=1 Tax=Chiloscyllium plagiosum TaxID=36176 RepID=UPI001CB803D1